jgi:phosphoribosylformylglycinamidine synthase
MWQFSEAIDGIAEACTALETPITGGNVSFYNETLGKSIYPTPVIGVLGIIENASHAIGLGVREEGDIFVLLDGSPALDQNASSTDVAMVFSSSEYIQVIADRTAGVLPPIDLVAEKNLQRCLLSLAAQGAIRSAHDLSDGGLAIALAESCFASFDCAGNKSEGLSAQIKLRSRMPDEAALFGERGARAVVSLAPTSLARVLESARQYNVGAQEIGQVTGAAEFRIELNGHLVVESSIEALRDAWANSLERIFVGR